MSLLQAFLYGLVQGITEFLPVSSSAHLALLPQFLRIEDPGALFDLAIHLGTAFSILLYFKKEVRDIIQDSFSMARTRKITTGRQYFALNFIIATFATVILAFFVKNTALLYGRTNTFIACNFIFFGLIMVLADALCKSHEQGLMEQAQWKRSLLIGLSQVLALFPGVSRSGATLTMGRLMGLGRREATRFSFLLSLPLIWGGLILECRTFLAEDRPFSLLSVLVGLGSSFVCGLIVIHYFLKWVSNIGLWPFALYRIIFGLILLFAF